ncbi:site-specific recombinase, DNA invertase Pin [Clostridium sartagoforme AAU1]|uniref:Site-specific recombinase, DNA invertase Pin n=1 Tax=Clostridium sartagoforme AAU1 TaxID=1202534 RepID=R9CFM0_9CLOT|nr:recombinase family protein [Clostridium sartagoforme]EOR28078.1 site-specific recombinase, DNA invertase Pin [Clostridium sartagoforme AAU1]
MRKIWNVAIYARVSTDKDSQSESIPAQVGNLKKWLIEKSTQDKEAVYNLVNIYEDQGQSGSNFDRDAFLRMKQDIEDKKINMVLTRDLSRFSRDYIMAGYYLEDYFKVNNVRFISVLDNVDTETEFNDIIPFKNILNEMYIKDCSKRVRSALGDRMQRGSSIASKPPYGYKFEELYEGNQKTIILVPEGGETTEVVKEIFDLYQKGWGFGRIATYLNKKGILPPSARLKNFKRKKFGMWTNNTIQSILKNPKYGGYMVQQRWRKVSYKIKKVKATPEEEWIWSGEFDGIIDKKTFNKVQKNMEQRKHGYRYKQDRIYPFTTVLKCGGCGGSMSYRKKYKGYKCTNSQMGGGRCTPHSIKEDYLIEKVRIYIKSVIDICIDKDKYYKKVDGIVIENEFEKELSKVEQELSTLDGKFQKLYEDKLNEVISERNFSNMSTTIQTKQESLIKRKKELEEIVQNNNSDIDITKIYRDEIDKLLSLNEIDRNFVEALVDKIIVNEDKETKEKSVDIYFKFKK